MTTRSALTVILLAVVVSAVPPDGTPRAQGISRYWCHDYIREVITGVHDKGLSVDHLKNDVLYPVGFRKLVTYPDLRSLAASEAFRPGDVIIIGRMHSAMFVTTDTLNHFLGQTTTDAAVMSWTIGDLEGFARTRNPGNGAEIPPLVSFRGQFVELWRCPGNHSWRIPLPVGGPRCTARHVEKDAHGRTCGMRCKFPAGHSPSQPHADWGGHSWANLGSTESAALDGAWTYMGGRGRALVRQEGTPVVLDLTWLPAGGPSPHYRVQTTLRGAALDGKWECVAAYCGHESGQFHADIDRAGRTIRVSKTDDPAGRRNWNAVVLTR